jgi:anti-sigma regulatory factor (Ser/Thr protein kinase)
MDTVTPMPDTYADDQPGPRMSRAPAANPAEGPMTSTEELLLRSAHLSLLYEAGRLLGRTLDLDAIYGTLRDLIVRTMDCESLIISRYSASDGTIQCAYAWIEGATLDPQDFPVLPLAPQDQGLQSYVIHTGEPIRIGDVPAYYSRHAQLHFAEKDGTISDEPGEQTTLSLLMAPLTLDGKVQGVVQVQSYRYDAHTEDQLRLLEAFVGQVATASRNATLYAQAQNELNERMRIEEENRRLLTQMHENAEQQKGFYRDVLASVTQGKLWLCFDNSELPPRLTPIEKPTPVGGSEHLQILRTRVREICGRQGFSEERLQALATAVSEAAMNALVHAGGGEASIYADGDIVRVWVEDTGEGISMECLPRATLERGFSTAASLGHGFWLMLHMVDRLYLLTGPSGTTLVLEQNHMEPDPGWL